MKKPGRSSRVVLTPQGKVLRALRIKHGLSMRAAGEKLGYSDSYISQIENGRADPPKGESLLKFLKIYGDLTPKYFEQLCRDRKDEVSDAEVIVELLPKLNKEQIALLRTMAEQMASKKV